MAHGDARVRKWRGKLANGVGSQYPSHYLGTWEFKWGLSVSKWCDVKCSDMKWTDMIYVKWLYFEIKWNEVSYGEVLGDKSVMYIRVTLYWVYLIVLWLFHLGVSCTVVVVTYFVMCGCFGNMCVCICCVLYGLCCFCIASFMYIYSYLFCRNYCNDYCHRVKTQLQ